MRTDWVEQACAAYSYLNKVVCANSTVAPIDGGLYAITGMLEVKLGVNHTRFNFHVTCHRCVRVIGGAWHASLGAPTATMPAAPSCAGDCDSSS